ncbi:hypothetical protein D047_0635A, partial [Vibrio parahaemolyticus VPTS-2010_2]
MTNNSGTKFNSNLCRREELLGTLLEAVPRYRSASYVSYLLS